MVLSQPHPTSSKKNFAFAYLILIGRANSLDASGLSVEKAEPEDLREAAALSCSRSASREAKGRGKLLVLGQALKSTLITDPLMVANM